VRSQAVDAINTLGQKLSPEQIFENLAPKVLELFETTEWFTPRVSACGLVAIAYTGCKRCKKDAQCATSAGDKKAEGLAGELAEAYRKQFQDTEPMVRRSAASKLAEAATSFGDETTKAELVDVFSRLIEEQEQESIRVNALKSAPTIFRVASLTDSDSEAGNKYLNCAIDKSWRVRVAVSESLPAVAHSRKANAQEIQTCQDTFMALLRDSEAEVRHATAAQSAAAASVLGPQFAVRELVPAVKGLVQDDGVANRVDLAGVLLEMAGPIGMQLSKQVYLQPQAEGESGAGNTTLLESLLNDTNTNLRLAVISKLLPLIDVLTIPQASEGTPYRPATRAIARVATAATLHLSPHRASLNPPPPTQPPAFCVRSHRYHQRSY
jgi:serine/threonine-protein phosphatase 2A regulatory subunit A